MEKLASLFTFGKIAFGITAAGLTAWVVSFFVADYVTKAAMAGLTQSIQTLEASVGRLSTTIARLEDDVKAETRRFRDDRQALAEDIARRAYELQLKNVGTTADISQIKDGIARIEVRLDKMGAPPIPR
jgi:hypothetical protein